MVGRFVRPKHPWISRVLWRPTLLCVTKPRRNQVKRRSHRLLTRSGPHSIPGKHKITCFVQLYAPLLRSYSRRPVSCRSSRIFTRSLEQFSSSETLTKLVRRKDENTILGLVTLGLQADENPPLDPRMILSQRPQTSEMVSRHSARCFGFNSDLHIIYDKVDFDTAG